MHYVNLGPLFIKWVNQGVPRKKIEEEALQKLKAEKQRFQKMNLGELVRAKREYSRQKRRIGIFANTPMITWQKQLAIRILNDLLSELESLINNHGEISP